MSDKEPILNALWETNNTMNMEEVIDNADFFEALYEVRNALRNQLKERNITFLDQIAWRSN